MGNKYLVYGGIFLIALILLGGVVVYFGAGEDGIVGQFRSRRSWKSARSRARISRTVASAKARTSTTIPKVTTPLTKRGIQIRDETEEAGETPATPLDFLFISEDTTLQQNSNYQYIIVANGITFDCDRHTIDCTSDDAHSNYKVGIELREVQNIVVKNCKVKNCNTGIYLRNAHSNNLKDNTVTLNNAGIILEESTENNIGTSVFCPENNSWVPLERNTVFANANEGILLKDNSHSNRIHGNYVYQNGALTRVGGINIRQSNFNEMYANMVCDNFKDFKCDQLSLGTSGIDNFFSNLKVAQCTTNNWPVEGEHYDHLGHC